jgi:hypothetical protein
MQPGRQGTQGLFISLTVQPTPHLLRHGAMSTLFGGIRALNTGD